MARSPAEFLVLALDIGTSSTRTALFDNSGRRLASSTAAEKYHVSYGDDGRAELKPADLLRAVTRARNRTLRVHISASRRRIRVPITLIGGSAFWHGLLGLDRKLKPITPMFTWADSRATAAARKLRDIFQEREIHQRTGCMLRATFWPAKLCWLRDSQPKLFRKVAHWVSPSDWIFHELFGDLRSSASMASGTGLFNLATRTWDEKLAAACEVKIDSLPELTDSLTNATDAGEVRAVFCPIGDGAAGNLGSGADRTGIAAINVGTSAAVRMIQDVSGAVINRLPYGLFRYVVDNTRTIIGGAISNAGNLREWCLRELRLNEQPAATERVLSRKLAAVDSLTVLPFWVEERAPSWPEKQRGVIDGLTQAITAGEIARSCATATFYRLAQILDEMERSLGYGMNEVVISGGILRSPASLRILADALGRDLQVSVEPEASLRGAVVHALAQVGIKIPRLRSGKKIKPDQKLAALHQQRRKRQTQLEQIMTQHS